ncbi:MAG TPA: EamA family transporter [Jiangellaceae bacterium]|nr:EamA family transporter [Jiangellaceae bacterium]
MSRLGSVPPPALVLLGIGSVQLGAGLAKTVFDELAPSAMVLLRLATSAIVLTIVGRRVLRGAMVRRPRQDFLIVVAFGVTLALMNFAIYESMARIPLGIAVTIEFLGPLGVAVAFSRRLLDLAWVALAAAGVLLLARDDGSGRVTVAGVAFALLAAAGWAAYILFSTAIGRRFTGSSGLALASIVGTVLMLPVGISTGGDALLRPELLAVGVTVGLLSSVIPYTLELEALRRMRAQLFGILMSLEPAAAAIVGLVILSEILALHEWAAVACVVLASVGASRTQPQRPEVPEG